jgi:hypothetical protein
MNGIKTIIKVFRFECTHVLCIFYHVLTSLSLNDIHTQDAANRRYQQQLQQQQEQLEKQSSRNGKGLKKGNNNNNNNSGASLEDTVFARVAADLEIMSVDGFQVSASATMITLQPIFCDTSF